MRMNLSQSMAALIRQQKTLRQTLVDFVDEGSRFWLDESETDSEEQTLRETSGFGSNPGSLRMLSYVPPRLRQGAPLVVVLHGCGQSAADFDRGSGWSKLARQHGFALLYPEQSHSNNSHGCFNWFRPSAVSRDRGEAGSVRQMIASMVDDYALDTGAIYIMGLSAGGALTAALLAAYPEVFRAGAIVAGLPFGAARDAMHAFSVMKNGAVKTPEEWAHLVQQAAPEATQWPRISIWHGTDDQVVNVKNADALRMQWLAVHGLTDVKSKVVRLGKVSSHVWHDAKGEIKVESTLLDGLDHGVPIASGQGEPMPFMLSSALHLPDILVSRWGLSKWSLNRSRVSG